MWGVSESREPIKGEFAKKLKALVNKMRQRKIEKQEELKKEYKEGKIHNVIRIDENFDRFSLLMNTPLEDISLEDLQWAAEQPYNSLTSKNIFLAEIERRKHDI